MSQVPTGAWVVIAAYNNAGVIRRVVKEVGRLGLPVLVIDDNSQDGTDEEALAGGALVRRHAVTLGQEMAIQTGIDYAIGHGAQYIFTFDPSGQYSAEVVRAMADVHRTTGADIVLGSRWVNRVEQIPNVLKVKIAITRLRDRLNVTDTDNCLRLFTREAAILVSGTEPPIGHASRILSKIAESGLKVVETPVSVRRRNNPQQKPEELPELVHAPVRSAVRDLISVATSRSKAT